MPFVKGKFGKAVWKHEAPRNYVTKEEAIKDLIRREKRWEKGHDGLDGDHYMYLTEFGIRDRVLGQRIPVDFRPADAEMIFPWLKRVEEGPKDGLWFTQRGAGKSTLMSGFLPMRTAIKFPGSLQIMTSEAVSTTITNFQDKLKPIYESMHPEFRPTLKSSWPTEKEDNQIVEFGIRKRGKIDEGSGSVIKSIETAQGPKSPAKLEGQGVIKYYVDELFKHPFPDDVFSRGGPLTKTYMKKVGCAYFFGSLSDKNARGREKAVEMIKNAGTLGIEFLFMDATWVNPEIEQYDDRGNLMSGKDAYINCLDENGYIDRKKARKAIERNYGILEKNAAPKFALEYKLKYPLELDTMLDLATSDYWTPEEIECANAQKTVLYIAKKEENFNLVDQPALVYRANPSADFRKEKPDIRIKYGTPREQSKFFIFEEFIAGRQYGMGTDTIPFNTPSETGSDSASVVKCFDTNQLVAAYIDRSYDARYVSNNCINLQLLYSDQNSFCLNLVEMNSIGAMKTAYESMGLVKFLAQTPLRFRPKTPSGFMQLGLNKDRNAAELTQAVRDYTVGNMDIINFWRFFEEFYGFPLKNSDFMSAMAMVEMLHEDYRTLKTAKDHMNRPLPNTTQYGWNDQGQRVLKSIKDNGIRRDGSLDLRDIFKPIGK